MESRLFDLVRQAVINLFSDRSIVWNFFCDWKLWTCRVRTLDVIFWGKCKSVFTRSDLTRYIYFLRGVASTFPQLKAPWYLYGPSAVMSRRCAFGHKSVCVYMYIYIYICVYIYIYIYIYIYKQSHYRLEGPRGFPDFMTTAQDGGKVVSLTHRPPLPPGNTTGTHFC